MDFTFYIYKNLLKFLKTNGYDILTFEEFMEQPNNKKVIVLRHDVDRKPKNALKMAKMENMLGVKSTYFFRIVNHVWDEQIVKDIVALGHEVSYHYEDLSIKQGNKKEAIKHFEYWLNRIRQHYPSKTICMHGSPVSKWDNRSLWENYNYKDYGIIAEPYFDVSYDNIFYLTDTGRSWNNKDISIRDHVKTRYRIQINSTEHMIQKLKDKTFPSAVMLNTHPHRWSSNILEWSVEYLFQNIKNQLKKIIIRKNG